MVSTSQRKAYCFETIRHLRDHHRWVRNERALNAFGKKRDVFDQDVVRRDAFGWLRFVVYKKVPDQHERVVVIWDITYRFLKLHGKAMDDVNDDEGRQSVMRKLRQVAVAMC